MTRPKLAMLKPLVATLDTRTVKPMPKHVDPHYSTAEHRQWRTAVLARAGGICQDPRCKTPHRHTRLFADHIVERRDGGAPFDLANGMARCGSCHTTKTVAARAARMRAVYR